MQRITSTLYRIVGIVYGFLFIIMPFGFFEEPQPWFMYIALLGIEIILALFIWACLNFVDIYLTDDGQLEFRFRKAVVEISEIIRIRTLPVAAGSIGHQFTVAYIRFIDTAGNKKLKFFIIPMRSWYYIEQLKTDKKKQDQ